MPRPPLTASLSLCLALGSLAVPGAAQTTITETWRLPAPYHADNPGLAAGLSGVGVSGDLMAVGATRMALGSAGASVADVGAVYLLRIVAGSPQLEAVLRPPGQAPAQFFGRELSLDGDRIAVGSIGAVDLFERDPRGQWQHVTTFSRSVFSLSVSLSGDRLAVGNWDATVSGASRAGRVDLYHRRADGSWAHEVTLTDPTPAAGDTLGKRVDLSGDRLIAFTANRTGGIAVPTAMVFALHNGAWQVEAELQPSWPGGAFRLSSIDLCGDTVVIQGTPFLAVFERQASGWREVQTIDKRIWGFGPTDRYQDLSGDRLVVASLDRIYGGVGPLTLLFERVGGRFVKQAVLTQTDGRLLAAPAVDGDLVAMVAATAISGCLGANPPTCGVGATFVYSLEGLGQSYGRGCPGGFLSNFGVPAVPDLETSRVLTNSGALEIQVLNASPGTSALLMIGPAPGSRALGGGCALGMDSAPILLGPFALSGTAGGPPGSGALSVSIPLPAGFRGQVATQTIVLDPSAANGIFSLTRSTLVRIR